MSIQSNIRQKNQLVFYESNENLIVGNKADLPLAPEILRDIDETSPYVVKMFSGGLSAIVYQLEVEGTYYTLKKARNPILVDNIDGKTSFLNELQRREEVYRLKRQEPARFSGIVDTIYGDFRQGILLSHWIKGEEASHFNRQVFGHLFYTMIEMAKVGIFVNDPTTANILVDYEKNQITLFDFGYDYPYDPLKALNGDGLDNPVFRPVERFESRAFMLHLDDIWRYLGKDKPRALSFPK